jgi:Mg2+ and Co2+ transporter CorA
MKVTISYNVDYEDVPRTLAQMLKNLYDIEYPEAGKHFMEARTNVLTGRYSEALNSIDSLRKELGKLDQKLLDYANIMNGYAKADADLQAGMREEEIYSPPQNPTQEVSAENIIDEEKDND